MQKLTSLRAALVTAGLLCMSATYAQTMSSADYKASKDRIGADYKAAKASCDKLSANAKDICVAEAKGKEKVAKAELEYGHSGKPADLNEVAHAKAEAAYDVAKEKCDDKAGNDKDVCVMEAKAVEVKAKADAKVIKDNIESRKEASSDKRDADYKVAVEKCDALAGDAKSSCVTAAKTRFGKS